MGDPIFWGLFLILGAIVLGYFFWMRAKNKRE